MFLSSIKLAANNVCNQSLQSRHNSSNCVNTFLYVNQSPNSPFKEGLANRESSKKHTITFKVLQMNIIL